MEEGGDFKMGWEGSSVGVMLKLGRGSVDQEPCVKNLSFVRRQGWSVMSEVGGRWKGLNLVKLLYRVYIPTEESNYVVVRICYERL